MSAVIGPKEMVVTTAFYVKNSNEGKGPSKPVFTTSSAVFSRFEQLDEVMEWANKQLNENGKRLLKVELAPNSR